MESQLRSSKSARRSFASKSNFLKLLPKIKLRVMQHPRMRADQASIMSQKQIWRSSANPTTAVFREMIVSTFGKWKGRFNTNLKHSKR